MRSRLRLRSIPKTAPDQLLDIGQDVAQPLLVRADSVPPRPALSPQLLVSLPQEIKCILLIIVVYLDNGRDDDNANGDDGL
jgi:hypothetical protein